VAKRRRKSTKKLKEDKLMATLLAIRVKRPDLQKAFPTADSLFKGMTLK